MDVIGVLTIGVVIIGVLGASCGQQRPRSPLVIEVTGDHYYWHMRYPGPDGDLHTPDDVATTTDLYVPAGVETEIRLTSSDYLYMFALPELELKQVAVPDLWFSLALPPQEQATYRLEGDQLCGFSHDSLSGTVVVQSSEEFQEWTERQPRIESIEN